MATALKLKNDIKKLKAAIASKQTPAKFLPKLKEQLEKAENELASMKKGGKPRKVSTTKGTTKTLSALSKLVNKKKYSIYKGAGVDLKKDAGESAFAVGRRVSKGLKANQYGDKGSNKGNVYYEYRPNRLDVKQPKKAQKYPKLELGGEISNWNDLTFSLSKHDVILVGGEHWALTKIESSSYGSKLYFVGIDDSNRGKGKYILQDYSGSVLEQKNFAKGGYMAKGGIYSSDSLYILKVSKDGKEVGEERFRAKNIKEAMEMGEDYEDKYKSKFGSDLSFSVKEATSKMARGGYMAKGGELDIAKIKKEYEENEENNAHSENVVLLAKHFGDESDLRDAKTILAKHEAIGYMPSYLLDERDALSRKLIKKMLEAQNKLEHGGEVDEEEEEVIRGYFEDEPYEYAGGGRLTKGSRWLLEWKDTDGNKGYDILEIVDTNFFSNKYGGSPNTIRVKVFASSQKDRINNYDEYSRKNLQSLIKNNIVTKLEHGGELGSIHSKTHRYDK